MTLISAQENWLNWTLWGGRGFFIEGCCNSAWCRWEGLNDMVMLFQRPACLEKTWLMTTKAATVNLCPRIWPQGWRSPSELSGRNRWPSSSFSTHPMSDLLFIHRFTHHWFAAAEELILLFIYIIFFVLIYFAHPRVKGRHQLLGKTTQCDLQLVSLSSVIGSSSVAVCLPVSCSIVVGVKLKIQTCSQPFHSGLLLVSAFWCSQIHL